MDDYMHRTLRQARECSEMDLYVGAFVSAGAVPSP